MHRHASTASASRRAAEPGSAPEGVLQRRCSCGSAPGPTGECAECRRKRRLGLQPRLRLSRPGDRFEREADRTADRVMRPARGAGAPARALRSLPLAPGPGPLDDLPLARRQDPSEPAFEEEAEDLTAENLLSKKERPGAGGEVPPGVRLELRSMRGGGRPLDPALRSFFEPRFGYDFDRVRVHTDGRAASSARALGARAYTLGRNIAFASGEYRPGHAAGRELIAHELAHVVQQRGETGTVMRACDCTKIPGASTPTSAQHSRLSGHFPRLVRDDWCVLGPATRTYNCIAWSVGDTSQWIWDQVDGYGNGDGSVSISDFDAFYQAAEGLVPSTAPSSNTRVALFGKGTDPTHAARVSQDSATCGAVPFTSKLGGSVRASHDLYQLEGGPTYGDVVRYYDVAP